MEALFKAVETNSFVVLHPIFVNVNSECLALHDGRAFIRSWCWDPHFRDRHLRKITEYFCLPAEKPKSAVYTQKTKRKLGVLGIRC